MNEAGPLRKVAERPRPEGPMTGSDSDAALNWRNRHIIRTVREQVIIGTWKHAVYFWPQRTRSRGMTAQW